MKHWLFFLLVSFIFVQCSDDVQSVTSTGTIAFVNRDNTTNHLYLMEVDEEEKGFQVRRITNDVESEDYPSWSPDGKMLTYYRGKDGVGIYIINNDGTGQKRLSPTPGFDVTPSWSPDGKQIVYTRVLGAIVPNVMPKTEIRIMNIDGSDDRVILPGPDFSVEPRWSVKNKIVFMGFRNGFNHVFTMNVDGSNMRQLTSVANNGDPAWSPDGTKISFGSDREGNNKLNIFSMDADGTNVRQLTQFNVPDEAGDTGWSPTGLKIAFEYDIDGKKQSDPEAFAEVWIVGADGLNAVSTQQRCSGVGCAPRWKPNP